MLPVRIMALMSATGISWSSRTNSVIPLAREVLVAAGGLNSRGGYLSRSMGRCFDSWPAATAGSAPSGVTPGKEGAAIGTDDIKIRVARKQRHMFFITSLISFRPRMPSRPTDLNLSLLFLWGEQ